ncbi:hypothetical protein [Mycolicibacterium septicum]|uniref:hypothetical protein n=1 Tax=Mycolicibacterium septicum TaxID=98668 RepID=UPI00235E7DCD|nr:hypothetical protein [Mycolicibacterium septicum]
MSAKRFETTHVYREHWFSLGIDTFTGGHYLSIPVSLQIADYTEFYAIDGTEYRAFVVDPASAILFADGCRRR